MADTTGTTDKADSSSHSTDIQQQQQQQQLAPRGESSSDSGNSANTPVSFWDFFQKLDDVNWCRNPFLVKERRGNGCEFNMGKALYQEGVDKLFKAIFITLDDA